MRPAAYGAPTRNNTKYSRTAPDESDGEEEEEEEDDDVSDGSSDANEPLSRGASSPGKKSPAAPPGRKSAAARSGPPGRRPAVSAQPKPADAAPKGAGVARRLLQELLSKLLTWLRASPRNVLAMSFAMSLLVIIFACYALGLFGQAGLRTVSGAQTKIRVGDTVFRVVHYGARADGKHDDTHAIQAAIDAAAAAGGGVISFGRHKHAGVFMTGRLVIPSSHILFDVPEGSTVRFLHVEGPGPLISAEGVEHIGFSGGGTIDGQGSNYWPCQTCEKPALLMMQGCRHVLVVDTVWKDAPSVTMDLACSDVEIWRAEVLAPPADGATVAGTAGPGASSGIVASGSFVYVHESRIETAMDSVQVLGSNFLMERCYVGRGGGAGIQISPQQQIAGISNVVFRNVLFNMTAGAAVIKAEQGASGQVTGVTFEDIEGYMVGMMVAIAIQSTQVQLSDVVIRNVVGKGSVNPETNLPCRPGVIQCIPKTCSKFEMNSISMTDSVGGWQCSGATGREENANPPVYLTEFGCGKELLPSEAALEARKGKGGKGRRLPPEPAPAPSPAPAA